MSAGAEDIRSGSADPPLTVELLADLQAGLLDDDAAARVRRQVRADPDAQATLGALNRVRSEVAGLSADPASAPDPPPGLPPGFPRRCAQRVVQPPAAPHTRRARTCTRPD